MENIAVIDSDSSKRGSSRQAGKSRKPSKADSQPGQGRAGTEPAASTQADIEVELSLLQSVFDQALEAGMRAKLSSQDNIIRIEIHGARICPECQVWTTSTPCQTCGCS